VQNSAPDVKIRAASRDDLPALLRIQQVAPEAAQWAPESYLAHDCTIAVAGEEVAGFMVTRSAAGEETELLNLAVDPVHRGRGIANRLMEELIRSARGTVFLEVRESNWAARKLYAKHGFREVARRANYYENPREAAVVLSFRSC
jgi:ribosomal-protein-alanine N-acetyltransferase